MEERVILHRGPFRLDNNGFIFWLYGIFLRNNDSKSVYVDMSSRRRVIVFYNREKNVGERNYWEINLKELGKRENRLFNKNIAS